MKFTFTVEVEIERDQGLFATRDEMAEQLTEALESADESSWTADGGGEYSTVSWSVHEVHEDKPMRSRRSKKPRMGLHVVKIES